MDQNYYVRGSASAMLSLQSSAVCLGPIPKHQIAAGSALAASVALASSIAIMTPGRCFHGCGAIFRSLRHLSAGIAMQTSGTAAGTVTSATRGWRPRVSVGVTSSFSRVGAGGGADWWRRYLQLQPQRCEPHQLLLQPFLRNGSSRSVTAVAAATATATACTARGSVAASRCNVGFSGRRGLGLLSRLNVRNMATQSTTRAAARSSASTFSSSSSRLAMMTSSGLGPQRGPISRFRGNLGDAMRLQLAAAWQKYGTAAYTALALATVFILWRTMRSVTNAFISVNDRMAEYGIMAFSASLVLLGALYLRWRTEINPAAVYRKAMVQLNTHPGVLEVMGAPLVGSPVRAYVVTGGGLYLSKRFRIKLRSRRIQMMFPLSGADRKGLVSLEAKRKHGRYVWKLVAVDLGPELQQSLPAGGSTGLSAAGPQSPSQSPSTPPPPPHLEQARVYVVGDLAAYQRGGVLGELRSPFLKALSNSRSYEVEDELEDELDELSVPKSSTDEGDSGVLGTVRKVLTSLRKPFPPTAATSADTTTTATALTPADGKSSSSAVQPNSSTSSERTRPDQQSPQSQTPSSPPTAASPPSPPPTSPSSSLSWWSRLRTTVSGPSQQVAGVGAK